MGTRQVPLGLLRQGGKLEEREGKSIVAGDLICNIYLRARGREGGRDTSLSVMTVW